MTTAQKISQIAQNIQSGNLYDLQQGLQKVSKISKQQLQSNESSVALPIQQLTQAVERNIRVNQDQIKQGNNVINTIKKITDKLPNQIKRQVKPVMNDIQKQIKKTQAINKVEDIIDKRVKQIQKQIQNNASQLQVLNISNVKMASQMALTPIEQSVVQYRPVLNLPVPQMTKPNQLPQTMQLLTRYVSVKGRIPVGSVTNQLGNSYVGVRQVQVGNSKQLLPYQINEIPKTTVPSIPIQLQYHANKTINSWNNYIKNQSQFVQYFSKINSEQKRQQYVENQFKTMNSQTFSAQIIATIIHYYIFIPFKKILHRLSMNRLVEQNLQGYLKVYELAGSHDQNPLLIGPTIAKLIVTLLFNLKGKLPSQIAQQITSILKTQQGAILEKQLNKMLTYVETKTAESKQFMTRNGLDAETIAGVLGSGDWSSVKKKKFLISGGLLNPQINNIAKKIIQSSKQKQKQVKKFSLSWGSQQMICHDYIWNWGRK